MRSERIQQILEKNGVAQSEELSKALETILKEFSKDSELIDNVDKGIGRKSQRSKRLGS